MSTLFLVSAIVAVIATLMTITRSVVVHALLYLIVSLLAMAMVFAALGAPFAAALEVIIYAGAIMVLFVFVVMMLNLGAGDVAREGAWLTLRAWIGPGLLGGLLALELLYAAARGGAAGTAQAAIGPERVGLALFGPYMIAVELASMLLLAGLVGALHLGRAALPDAHREPLP